MGRVPAWCATRAARRATEVGAPRSATRRPASDELDNFGSLITDEDSWIQQLTGVLITITDAIPKQALGRPPKWTDELTYEPVA